jgi:hypothetical protein
VLPIITSWRKAFCCRGCEKQCFAYQVSRNAGRGTPLLIIGSTAVSDCNWPALCHWLIGSERTNQGVRIRKIYAEPLTSVMKNKTAIYLNLKFHLFTCRIIVSSSCKFGFLLNPCLIQLSFVAPSSIRPILLFRSDASDLVYRTAAQVMQQPGIRWALLVLSRIIISYAQPPRRE